MEKQKTFVAKIPHPIKIGDEFILEGKLADDAKDFAVNFKVDDTIVACNFRTYFRENRVIFNYKVGRKYKPSTEMKYEITWAGEPGKTFVLKFRFGDQEILIHTGDENPILKYTYKFEVDMGDIQELEVLYDVDYITKIVFRRKLTSNFASNF